MGEKSCFLYIKGLSPILKSDQKYIIEVVDDFGILAPLVAFFLREMEFRMIIVCNFLSGWFYENT